MEASPAIDPRRQWDIHRFSSIDSTNRWVLDQAAGGAPAGLVALSDHQTSGRGRQGRVWLEEPKTSLLVSVLLRPRLDLESIHTVAMAAGLSLLEALPAQLRLISGLKWPNDVVVGQKKLAGVLAESILPTPSTTSPDSTLAVVVGVGCNLAQRDFPSELSEFATSCALELDIPVARDSLLDEFLARLTVWNDLINKGDLSTVVAAYRNSLETLGTRVRVDLGNKTIEGIATDIDEVGHLLITGDQDERFVVAVGDVVHLRRA